MDISVIKTKQLWDNLTLIMGIPILARWHLYIETAPKFNDS